MKNHTIVLYLTGKPGVGKYTIAKILANKHAFVICDNQLINNPIFELLQYDGQAKIPEFAWEAIADIRTVILNFLTKNLASNYILTNCLAETDKDRKLYEEVKRMAQTRGSIFIPVKFLISKEAHLQRLTRAERRDRWKSIDPKEAEDHGPLLAIDHPNYLELEISDLTAEQAAEKIMQHITSLTI